MDFSKFEDQLGIYFKNKSLLQTAFTHRSFINENRKGSLEHNERLEFLGDAVLELISTHFLYNKYPDKTEGDLTSYRSALVNAVTLADVAAKLGMNEFLLLSRGETKDVGRARQYILANTMEAFIGALFLDQGLPVTETFIKKYVLSLIDDIVAKKSWLDAKSFFQEKAQEIDGVTPSYTVLKETGPDHDKHFTVAVEIGRERIAVGDGKSKQEAEQDAARKGLEAKGWH
ncbi:MAG: Ribonuclease 3 [Candidatus Kaiserbacteria bacterium GW2011_GWA2_49_19]|uniref:Ribonuclease 3 n=1 Tax=Candidatus Kaiserbacteria bacterium GW2011_GWA2_49_19 TaxID=1618669 RepID=A0A0G1XZW1_9BACT|nr:MAG: Ribonuclease 3 [Candidatus Kaiserbacteria bacterium GW2011_GWA2_49_19]